MKVITINYQKVFPLGQYINERIGVEIQVDADDNENDCLKQAKLIVERFHNENNPHLYQEQTPEYTNLRINNTDYSEPIPTTENLTQEQKINNLINQSTSIVELEQWKLLASNSKYPSLKESYDKKLKELTND